MQPNHFEEAVTAILHKDSRYDAQAYLFLKDSLDFTFKKFSDEKSGRPRHVTGKELLEGFRDHAIERFGPMAGTLMEEWGVNECRDVGNMVFLMIEEQVFGKQESDKPEDFDKVFDLHKSLREPFQPTGGKPERKARAYGRG